MLVSNSEDCHGDAARPGLRCGRERAEVQFREKYGDERKREDLVIQRSRRSNNAEQILVFFPEEEKVGVKTINTYVDRTETKNILLCSSTSRPLLDNA